MGGGGGGHVVNSLLHLTCNAQFRTRMSYSSQKSCVKIWFGLVELGGMLIFCGGGGVGGRTTPIGGVTCDLRCPSSNLPELYFSQKSCVKIWFGLVEPFKSYRANRKKKNLNKRKSQTRLQTIKIFPGGNKTNRCD